MGEANEYFDLRKAQEHSQPGIDFRKDVSPMLETQPKSPVFGERSWSSQEHVLITSGG